MLQQVQLRPCTSSSKANPLISMMMMIMMTIRAPVIHGVNIAALILLLAFSMHDHTTVLGVKYLKGIGEYSDGGLFLEIESTYTSLRDDIDLRWQSMSTVEQSASAYLIQPYVFMVTHGPISMSDGTKMAQIPMSVGALVAVCNLGTQGAYDVVMDQATLIGIWNGTITHWRDPAIVELNPNISSAGILPDADIVLVYSEEDIGGSLTGSFKRFVYGASDVEFADRLPMNNTNYRSVVGGSPARLQSVVSTSFSMTFLALADVAASSPSSTMIKVCQMKTSLSTVLSPNVATSLVESSSSYSQQYLEGDDVVDIIDTSANARAWPMSYVTYGTLRANTTDNSLCTQTNEFIIMASWMLLNKQASATTQSFGQVIIGLEIVRIVLDRMQGIICAGNPVSRTSYLIGVGSFNPFPSLGYYYGADKFALKYIIGNSAASTRSLRQGSSDFGQTSQPLPAADVAAMPDVMTIPIWCWGAGPYYNVPELIGKGIPPLKMNWEVLAGIYLNKITSWDDQAIVDLNGDIAHLLPKDRKITVVYQINDSVLALIFNTILSRHVTEYNATVGIESNFKKATVVKTANRSIGVNGFTFSDMIESTPYTLGLSMTPDTTGVNQPVHVWNSAGNLVAPDARSVIAAVADNADKLDQIVFYDSPGNYSWPMSIVTGLTLRSRSMKDFAKARVLADWIYWMQTSETGRALIASSGYVPAYNFNGYLNILMKKLYNVTSSNGDRVSSLAACIVPETGALCSENGVCSTASGLCSCNPGWTGALCDEPKSESVDSLAIGLGVSISGMFLLLLVMAALLVIIFLYVSWRRRQALLSADYYIDAESELELGDKVGQGGFGEVYKGRWRGTEVAVKMLPKEAIVGREEKAAFKDEISIMSKLRHPNVVLFMAACVEPPLVCIVMEFMGLGSLYDLLQNDLVPELPMLLRMKLVFQAAKGMHFLHSSGVVHRDLKSLNLLLDARWNLKVSDFGLSAIRDNVIKKKKDKNETFACSIVWAAPEVLAGDPDQEVDYILADIYSFGIIMWEVLTRSVPYQGLTQPQIAVGVIRDGLRPDCMELDDLFSTASCNSSSSSAGGADESIMLEYLALMKVCWDAEPMSRPGFHDILAGMKQITSVFASTNGASSSRAGGTITSTANSSAGSSTSSQSLTNTLSARRSIFPYSNYSLNRGGRRQQQQHQQRQMGSINSTTTSGSSEASSSARNKPTDGQEDHASSSSSGSNRNKKGGAVKGGSMILGPHEAYNMGPAAQLPSRDMTFVLYDLTGCNEKWISSPEFAEALILKYIRRIKEAVKVYQGFVFSRPVANSGGTLSVAFHSLENAIKAAIFVQKKFPEHSRVSMHYHAGSARVDRYQGYPPSSYEEAFRINRMCPEGAILCSSALGESFKKATQQQQQQQQQASSDAHPGGSGGGPTLSSEFLHSEGIKMVAHEDPECDALVHMLEWKGSPSEGAEPVWMEMRSLMNTRYAVGSSDMCPWIIDPEDLKEGEKLGEGSYGSVYQGTHRGESVAIKKLYNTHINERQMLAMRREAAVLSNLSHPNIVAFIGLCAKQEEGPMIVMELVRERSLDRLIYDHSVKIRWLKRLFILRGAALGIEYLHQCRLIHRDIKSSNILVDKDGLVAKVADFGFATAKQDDCTRTRCGTPAWSAPETLFANSHYDNKADVYSFGVVMWEMAARRQPEIPGGKGPMALMIDIIEGKRFPIPSDVPPEYADLMRRCWDHNPEKRPSMTEVVVALNAQIGDDADHL